MSTVQQVLDKAPPHAMADMLRKISFGELLAGLRPRLVARADLASSATQIHSVPGAILQVTDAAGTTAVTIVTGTAGAGEVTVTYDANGLATLVFGTGAVTAYNVLQLAIPAGLVAALAADAMAGV